MALDTYANLKTALINWSGRDDLSSVLDDFIDLTESVMYHDQDTKLRIRAMENQTTLTTGTANRLLTTLPASFIELRSIHIVVGGERIPLTYREPQALNIRSGTGQPLEYTITANIEFDIVPDTAYSIDINYYGELTALSSANTSNTALTHYSGIYLHGCLYHLYMYASEEQKAQFQWDKFVRAVKGANREDSRARTGPAPAARAYGRTP